MIVGPGKQKFFENESLRCSGSLSMTGCEKMICSEFAELPRNEEMTERAAGGGLSNFEGCQLSWLQNLEGPSVTCVDFHSYSLLHAFEKQDQQNWAQFLVAAIQKHPLCVVELFSLLAFPLKKNSKCGAVWLQGII